MGRRQDIGAEKENGPATMKSWSRLNGPNGLIPHLMVLVPRSCVIYCKHNVSWEEFAFYTRPALTSVILLNTP